MLSRGYGPAVVPYHITDGDGKITEATSWLCKYGEENEQGRTQRRILQ